MLGTGIASADEDVNPDKPASPLDGSITVPVHIDNNALGTPFGQKAVPTIHKDLRVSVADLTGAVPMADKAAPAVAPVVDKARQAAAPVAGKVTDQAQPVVDGVTAKVTDQAQPVTDRVTDKATPLTDKAEATAAKAGLNVPSTPALPRTPGLPDVEGVLAGNRVDGDVVVPVVITGNAVAIAGKAEVEDESHTRYDAGHENVVTNGEGTFLGGNVVDLDYAAPIQITGNAIAALGKASAESSATHETTATSDVTTDGSNGFLAGNAVAGHGATPVQVTGNAIAGAGRSEAMSEAETSATSGGYVLTSGMDSAGSGNAAGVPVATPVELNGNAVAGLGKSDAESDSTADAQAGKERPGLYGVPTYIETNGDPALLAGNVAQPAASGPVLLCGNAGAAAGGSSADCTSSTETDAGGGNRSTGEGSVASGSIAHAPVALPADGFGNAAAAVGNAEATADNTVDSTAGGDSYTRGHDSVLSGTTATAPVGGPAEVFTNAAAGAGAASADSVNDVTSTAGGNTGTTGDDSAGGGNAVTTPVSLPVEGFGNTGAAAGGAQAAAVETKETTTGGGSNTDDDNGLLASNLVSTPVAGAAQAFGNSAGAVAFTEAMAATDNVVTAGGDNKATGTAGLGSGNIGTVPVSVPAQVFGTGVSGLAAGQQAAIADTETTAGGDNMSDGANSAGSGNVVSAPVGSAAQAFGESAAALGLNDSAASSDTESTAGGDTETDGTAGLISGNVVSPQALPVAQSFAAVASGVGGVNSSVADNDSDATSGGDIDTAGDAGFLSGNLVDVPAGAVAQPFGDAVSAVESQSVASGDNVSEGSVGGTSTTSGEFGSLSGIDGTLPVGANAPVYDVPVEVLAQAITESANDSELSVGEGQPQLDLPVSGGLSPTELPSILPTQGRSMPRDVALPAAELTPFAGSFSGVLTGFADGMTGLPGQDRVTEVADTVTGADEYHILPYPMPRSRQDIPFETVSGTLFSAADPAADPAAAVLAVPAGALSLGDARSASELPVGLPAVGDVPMNEIPLEELPISDELAGAPTMLSGATESFPAVGDATDATTLLPAVPAVGDLADVTTQMPALPAAPQVAGLTDVTQVVPTVPAVGDVTAVPAVQAPSLNTLPVEAPALSDVDATSALDDASLSDTRAALANLFTTHPIG
ncbi:MAG: hypothetical protein GEV28_11590 [Actinophytocola sp.]|uniref:hypothetical protein n=1 Tax=Actinophytocola sp. TaxID=1872138 RepID=UPI001323C84C|nr:hypothetical protein [Actinophytocola sp.]MPZ80998.1 hypothetical protein [Actinophytocola sp.]